MRHVSLSPETMDKITTDYLKFLRWEIIERQEHLTDEHEEDKALDKMRIAACDLLLSYLGAE